jgi:hypothetical protein
MRGLFHFIAGFAAAIVRGARWSRMASSKAGLCGLPKSQARNYREAINRFALSTVSPG